MLLGIALEALPESYGQLISNLDMVDELLTYEDLKVRVRTFYRRNFYKVAAKDLAASKALWIKDQEQDDKRSKVL